MLTFTIPNKIVNQNHSRGSASILLFTFSVNTFKLLNITITKKLGSHSVCLTLAGVFGIVIRYGSRGAASHLEK